MPQNENQERTTLSRRRGSYRKTLPNAGGRDLFWTARTNDFIKSYVREHIGSAGDGLEFAVEAHMHRTHPAPEIAALDHLPKRKTPNDYARILLAESRLETARAKQPSRRFRFGNRLDYGRVEARMGKRFAVHNAKIVGEVLQALEALQDEAEAEAAEHAGGTASA